MLLTEKCLRSVTVFVPCTWYISMTMENSRTYNIRRTIFAVTRHLADLLSNHTLYERNKLNFTKENSAVDSFETPFVVICTATNTMTD